MTKKIQQIVKASYTNGELDQANVLKIASLLRKAELKQYIRALKLNEQKRTVVVTSAYPLENTDQEALMKIYPKKTLITKTDLSLMLGLRILENDIIYELNLRDNLNKISNYIGD